MKLPPAFLVVAALPFVGCDAGPTPPAPPIPNPAPAAPVGSAFDPAACGRVAGRVAWRGDTPACPGFIYGLPRSDGNFSIGMAANPHSPSISPAGRSLAGAVVVVRGIDPARAKPWDRPPARVEMVDRGIRVRQGDAPPGLVGFVRRGDAVEMRSAEPVYHSLRARGATFFTLAFPEPDRPLTRTFDRSGWVHLTSGAGNYWASAFLHVSDHSYVAVTDADGRFGIDRVPAGPVEVAVWHPHWKVVHQERDPEACLITRQTYADPLEATAGVRVRAGETAFADVVLADK